MAFNGQLNQNEVWTAIYNMIIGQQVFSKNIAGTYSTLAEKFKADAGMLGDTKLYYSTQIGKVVDWTKDSEASNLLSLNRPAAPDCQAITINVFKMVWTTIDNFLSKRAFADEGTFGQFNSVILGTLRDAKRIYEATTVNVACGVSASTTGSQTQTITLSGTGDSQAIATALADIMVDVEDVSTNYNDLQYLRSYDKDDLVLVINSKYANKINYTDLPVVYHSDVIKNLFANAVILPARFFGDISSLTTTAGTATRSMYEQDIGGTHYRAGDLVPASSTVTANTTYITNDKIIAKIYHKDSFKFLSGFETSTEFINPRSLTENHYVIFAQSQPYNSRLKAFPCITLKKA